MTVLITLTTAGTDTGPFDLYSNVDGYVSAFETGVSKAALIAGYSSALVPDGTSTIRIKSTGLCVNYIDVTVTTTTTTTSSTTTTTTEPPTELIIYGRYINAASPGELEYTLNGGPVITIGPIGTSSCLYFYTISGLTVGDSIVFSDSATRAIAGSTSTCPSGPGGFSCTYNYSVIVSGSQSAYISVDGTLAC